MDTRDEKGFIRYTLEELNRIPSFEARERAGAGRGPAGTIGMLGGAAVGAAIGFTFGPVGAVIGALAGGVAGGAVGKGVDNMERWKP